MQNVHAKRLFIQQPHITKRRFKSTPAPRPAGGLRRQEHRKGDVTGAADMYRRLMISSLRQGDSVQKPGEPFRAGFSLIAP